MIPLFSQKSERQHPASCVRERLSVKHMKNFIALYYKTLGGKLAKQYLQSKNSTEHDIFGLEGFNVQAERYKPKKYL